MSMKIDPNGPAFPALFQTSPAGDNGLTIRAEIASRCLAGMLADGEQKWREGEWTYYINDAILFADTLIAKLNEEE